MSPEQSWEKRKAARLICPSGAICYAQRASPELSLKAGRLLHIFGSFINSDESSNEISDEDAAKTYLFARKVIIDCVVSPKLVDNSSEGLTPEDIPSKDFWYVFRQVFLGLIDLPVETKEGETTVESVVTFPEGQTAVDVFSGDGEQVSQVTV